MTLELKLTIDLSKYDYPKDKEQDLIKDLKENYKIGIDREVYNAIYNLYRNKTGLKKGWIIQFQNEMWTVVDVSPSQATIENLLRQNERMGISIMSDVMVISGDSEETTLPDIQ